jgi:hypothetical protein
MTVPCVVIDKTVTDFQARLLLYPNYSATSDSVTAIEPVPVEYTVKNTELADMDDQQMNYTFSPESSKLPQDSIKTNIQQNT